MNKHRLTSHFDTHLTLKHIIKLNGGTPSYEHLATCPTCQSLFREIPENRSCSDANIPINYCFCNIYKLVSYEDQSERQHRAAQLQINYMNQQLDLYGHDRCTTIKDPRIVFGWETDGLIVSVFMTNLDHHYFGGAVNLTNAHNPIYAQPHALQIYNKNKKKCRIDSRIYDFCTCKTKTSVPKNVTPIRQEVIRPEASQATTYFGERIFKLFFVGFIWINNKHFGQYFC